MPRNAWQLATVREWREDEGWGVVTTDDVPEGVWLHITDVKADGFPFLKPGDRLEVKFEGPLSFDQDGYRHRATVARPLGS